jgi:hypothetical protein
MRSFIGQQASKLGADTRGCTRHERSFPSWHRDSVLSAPRDGGREREPRQG